jgi:hypothetical protein
MKKWYYFFLWKKNIFISLFISFNLRSKEEGKVTDGLDDEFNLARLFKRKVQADTIRDGSTLGEGGEVTEGEAKFGGFSHEGLNAEVFLFGSFLAFTCISVILVLLSEALRVLLSEGNIVVVLVTTSFSLDTRLELDFSLDGSSIVAGFLFDFLLDDSSGDAGLVLVGDVLASGDLGFALVVSGAVADVTISGEANTIAVDGNGDSVAEDGEIAADFGEFGGGHEDGGLVVDVGDIHGLGFDFHEFHQELSATVASVILGLDGKDVVFNVVLQSQGIVAFDGLEDLAEVAHVEADDGFAFALVLFEASAVDSHGDESDVSGVHRLDVDTFRNTLHIDFSNELLHGINEFLPKTSRTTTSFK